MSTDLRPSNMALALVDAYADAFFRKPSAQPRSLMRRVERCTSKPSAGLVDNNTGRPPRAARKRTK